MINLQEILICEKNIIDNIGELQENIEIFNQKVDEIQTVIDTLKYYYNTTGGEEVIKKITDIEFNKNILGTISSEITTIKCEHKKNNVVISRKIIE